ncbi:MAG TPA: PAS domain S-box protein [Xenococcaceae cyanobacterium]
MVVTITIICLLLALVLYLSVKVRQQAIALRQIQRQQQALNDFSQLQTSELTQANQILQDEIREWEFSEQLIRSSEEKLRRALAYAPIPIVIHAEDGEILQINQAWTEITGYTINEIPTVAVWTEKAYGERKEVIRSEIDRLYELDRRVDEGEFEVMTASGQVRIWDFSSAPLGKLADGRRLVISAAKDITERKQVVTELQISEARFRNTFEQAAVGVAHVAPDGRWLRVNQKLCDIVGYTRKELLQTNFQNITYPEDLETDLAYVRQILAGEIATYSIEKRYICKDRSLVWINLTVSLVKNQNGEADYLICVIEAIGDRKKLELSLQKSLQRLENLHQIDKAILAAAKPEVIAQTATSKIQELINCQRTSIVTFDWEQQTATILAIQDRMAESTDRQQQVTLNVWQDLIARLEANDSNYLVTYLSQLPQLSPVFPTLKTAELDCFISFPLKAGGQLLGILKVWMADMATITSEELAIISEISDQIAIALQQTYLHRQTQNYTQELEARVAERTAQLAEINQELKAFSYSISHDLKAPLRAIQGFATALQEDYAENLDDLGKQYTWRLATSAQQMERLIQDLLAYSRLSRTEIELKSVDLDQVVTSAIEQLEVEIAEVQAQITIDEPLCSMVGNRTILVQIVKNLLSNAIKFVTPGVEPQIHIWTESQENQIRLWIEDNGIGIESQHQKRIFQVFERLHGNEAYPGTGIGLAIVKKGMERLNGSFGVVSEVAQGSRFWIEGLRG